jgi:SAM-dependent methyltransferase
MFWQERYANGGTSGPGSYGALAQGKAEFLNAFVAEQGVRSIIEFGCGDGNQLSLAQYPNYVGLDVSRAAVERCKGAFANDITKSFFLYDGECFVDHARIFTADAAVSLDVIYHLVEDSIYHAYMAHLFGAGQRYIIIYSTNGIIRDDAPHVQHRLFSAWVDRNCPQWRLARVVTGPGEGSRRADFFIYERRK